MLFILFLTHSRLYLIRNTPLSHNVSLLNNVSPYNLSIYMRKRKRRAGSKSERKLCIYKLYVQIYNTDIAKESKSIYKNHYSTPKNLPLTTDIHLVILIHIIYFGSRNFHTIEHFYSIQNISFCWWILRNVFSGAV